MSNIRSKSQYSNLLKGFFTLEEFCAQTGDLFPEDELIRMFKSNVKANDGKMTFPDYIRMVVSKNTNFDLSDNTLDHIERIYITPREHLEEEHESPKPQNMDLDKKSTENSRYDRSPNFSKSRFDVGRRNHNRTNSYQSNS